MKENVIFFGASKLGKIAKEFLENKYNIVNYCDNDVCGSIRIPRMAV